MVLFGALKLQLGLVTISAKANLGSLPISFLIDWTFNRLGRLHLAVKVELIQCDYALLTGAASFIEHL